MQQQRLPSCEQPAQLPPNGGCRPTAHQASRLPQELVFALRPAIVALRPAFLGKLTNSLVPLSPAQPRPVSAPAGTVLIGRGSAADKYSSTPIPTETDLSEDSYPGSLNPTPQQGRNSIWRLTSSSSSSHSSGGSHGSSPTTHSPPVRRLSVFLKSGKTGFTPRVQVDDRRPAVHRVFRWTTGALQGRASTAEALSAVYYVGRQHKAFTHEPS